MDTRRDFNTQDNEQPVEEGSNSKPDDHAEMSKELEPCDSSRRSMGIPLREALSPGSAANAESSAGSCSSPSPGHH
ncbi:unnamed protein product [Leuciscus chuanchicus]